MNSDIMVLEKRLPSSFPFEYFILLALDDETLGCLGDSKMLLVVKGDYLDSEKWLSSE